MTLTLVSRVRLARRLLHYVDDDDGDVVVAASVEGRGEQAARRPLRVVRRLGHNVREPVRTEQDAVAGLYREYGGVDIDLLVRAKGTGDEVLLGVLCGLIPGQVAATHQLGDERVVLCYRLHVATTHEVGSRITDVCHLGHGLDLRPTEPDGDHGSTHSRELLVTAASGHYPAVRLSYGCFEGFAWREIFEHVHGEGTRNLPGLEAAYAVGDDEERLVLAFADEQGVLIVLTDLAGVGKAERPQLEERHDPTPRT